MKQEELNKIIAKHVKWLQGKGGKRADLIGANLIFVDLEGVDLHEANMRYASLYGADLHRAYLEGVDLEGADLRGADMEESVLYNANLCKANMRNVVLRGADLRGANLHGADLRGANLEGAKLPLGMYQVVGAGSCNRCTTYDAINNQVICGCRNDKKGNYLDSFIDRVASIYGTNGEKRNSVYYAEDMSAITFFKAIRELNKKTQHRIGGGLE